MTNILLFMLYKIYNYQVIKVILEKEIESFFWLTYVFRKTKLINNLILRNLKIAANSLILPQAFLDLSMQVPHLFCINTNK